MSGEAPRIHVELCDEATVATLVDERIVDEVVIEAVGDQLIDLVERQGRHQIVLDFSKVRFLGSAMLAKLFVLKRRIEKLKGRLVLCGLEPGVRPVFNFAPRGAFEIREDVEEALEAI